MPETTPIPPSVHPAVLLRVARELDRFMIKLMQLEWNVSMLIEAHAGDLPDNTTESLQNIDMISQTSTALSMLMTKMSVSPEAGLDELLSDVHPNDLRERLYDRLLDDIDNVGQEIEFF